jgi:hypothetical protein
MFEDQSEERMYARLVTDIMMYVTALPPKNGWTIYVLKGLGCTKTHDGRLSGVIVHRWRAYEQTRRVQDLWSCCEGLWAHLRHHAERDHDLYIFNIIQDCVQDPIYKLTDEDKKHLHVFESNLVAFRRDFEKYNARAFPFQRAKLSGGDDDGLHALLLQLQSARESELSSRVQQSSGKERRIW